MQITEFLSAIEIDLKVPEEISSPQAYCVTRMSQLLVVPLDPPISNSALWQSEWASKITEKQVASLEIIFLLEMLTLTMVACICTTNNWTAKSARCCHRKGVCCTFANGAN